MVVEGCLIGRLVERLGLCFTLKQQETYDHRGQLPAEWKHKKYKNIHARDVSDVRQHGCIESKDIFYSVFVYLLLKGPRPPEPRHL